MMPPQWLTPELIERLAELSYDGYRARSTEQTRLPTYKQLNDAGREANRALIRDWPTKLASVGFSVTSDGARSDIVNSLPEADVERLAIDEHIRWLRYRAQEGYVWGQLRADQPGHPTHPDMIPWVRTAKTIVGAPRDLLGVLGPGELTEQAREKDRSKINEIIPLLRAVGLHVVPIDHGDRAF